MPKKKKSEAKSQQKEAIKNCKLYLDLDLSSKSAGGLLPYKFLLDSLTKAIENKDKTDEDSLNKLKEIFISVNKANYDIKISNEKKKLEKPLKSELDEAEAYFNEKHKKYEERKNFHNKLVEKGNKLQEDRNNMIKHYEEERQKLVDESNDYVKDLQKQTDPNNPERTKTFWAFISASPRLDLTYSFLNDENLFKKVVENMKNSFRNIISDNMHFKINEKCLLIIKFKIFKDSSAGVLSDDKIKSKNNYQKLNVIILKNQELITKLK